MGIQPTAFLALALKEYGQTDIKVIRFSLILLYFLILRRMETVIKHRSFCEFILCIGINQ